jgi:hypothetical protein
MTNKNSELKPLLAELFKNIAADAVVLKGQIDTAKTKLKKDYLSKKLAKVNKKAYAIMLELSLLENNMKQSDNSNDQV